MADTTGSLQSVKDFEPTPEGQYKYWAEEINSSMKARKDWWLLSDKIVKRFTGGSVNQASPDTEKFDLNLFHSNVKTLQDIMYGALPKIDVSRKYAQPDDDPGRVAGVIMERLLNINMADEADNMDAVFRATLQDRLLSGLGCAKVRYEVETAQEPIEGPDGQPVMKEIMVSESAPIEYHYWGDLLWGWCRNWAEMPWIGFRSYHTKDEVTAKWGEKAAEGMQFKVQTQNTSKEGAQNNETDSAWQKAEVWEIWCKATRKIHWISIGYDKQLEEKPDFLKLTNFWPVPPFFLANPTTSLYTPTPDFKLAQDLYNEIDKLQTRISIITEAVKVVGVYNSAAGGIQQMFKTGLDNDLIAVENWALFGENGGIAGQIDWVPLKDIVDALRELITIRDQTIQLLQQITGMTDVMRGSLDNQYEGVGQTEVKQKFGSVRIQALQAQFATFTSNLMQIKAEVIARHFSPKTIYDMANMKFSKDANLVEPAILLIKDPDAAKLRIEIRPESVAMVDYQALKGERTEYLTALATYMQSAVGMIAEDPSTKPFLLEMLQWGLAGFKGSSEIEGTLDKAIEASQKAEEERQGNEDPTPEQIAAQAAMDLEKTKQQGDMQKIQAKAQADIATRQADQDADIKTAHEAHIRKMAEIGAGMQAKVTETQVALQADLLMEKAQADSNIMQTQASVEGEIRKDVVETQLDMAAEAQKTEAEMQKILTAGAMDIQKTTVAAAAKPQGKTDA